MLSGETSVGSYAVEAVATMSRIVSAAEEDLSRLPRLETEPTSVSAAIARSAAVVARAVEASSLVAFTQSGMTARLLAHHRPSPPLLAFTPVPEVRSQLALTWGVETFLVPPGAAHRRHGAPGRQQHAGAGSDAAGRVRDHRRRQPAVEERVDERDARAPAGQPGADASRAPAARRPATGDGRRGRRVRWLTGPGDSANAESNSWVRCAHSERGPAPKHRTWLSDPPERHFRLSIEPGT
jgi:hypothetical protein